MNISERNCPLSASYDAPAVHPSVLYRSKLGEGFAGEPRNGKGRGRAKRTKTLKAERVMGLSMTTCCCLRAKEDKVGCQARLTLTEMGRRRGDDGLSDSRSERHAGFLDRRARERRRRPVRPERRGRSVRNTTDEKGDSQFSLRVAPPC